MYTCYTPSLYCRINYFLLKLKLNLTLKSVKFDRIGALIFEPTVYLDLNAGNYIILNRAFCCLDISFFPIIYV